MMTFYRPECQISTNFNFFSAFLRFNLTILDLVLQIILGLKLTLVCKNVPYIFDFPSKADELHSICTTYENSSQLNLLTLSNIKKLFQYAFLALNKFLPFKKLNLINFELIFHFITMLSSILQQLIRNFGKR